MYILDTDTLSNLFKKHPSTKLIQKLASVSANDQYTTSINIGEMVYGASRLPHGEALLEKISKIIHPDQVLPFDYQSSFFYGKTRGTLEKKRIFVDQSDLRIASVALTCKMTVITRNIRDFSKIPNLKIENWID